MGEVDLEDKMDIILCLAHDMINFDKFPINLLEFSEIELTSALRINKHLPTKSISRIHFDTAKPKALLWFLSGYPDVAEWFFKPGDESGWNGLQVFRAATLTTLYIQ